MPKKDLRKLESTIRKTETCKHLNNIGLSINDPIKSIAIIFDNLLISQLTYYGIKSINNICNIYPGIDIQVFVKNISMPCIKTKFATYPIKNLMECQNPIIVSDLSTCIECLEFNMKNIYYYVFDLEFLNNFNISNKLLRRAFLKPIIICRSEDHKKVIEKEFNIQISSPIINDFNLEPMIKLIMEKK